MVDATCQVEGTTSGVGGDVEGAAVPDGKAKACRRAREVGDRILPRMLSGERGGRLGSPTTPPTTVRVCRHLDPAPDGSARSRRPRRAAVRDKTESHPAPRPMARGRPEVVHVPAPPSGDLEIRMSFPRMTAQKVVPTQEPSLNSDPSGAVSWIVQGPVRGEVVAYTVSSKLSEADRYTRAQRIPRPKTVGCGRSMRCPVIVRPGAKGPVNAETACSCWPANWVAPPVKTHRVVLGQDTLSGLRSKPFTMAAHGTGELGEPLGLEVEVVVVTGSVVTVVDG